MSSQWLVAWRQIALATLAIAAFSGCPPDDDDADVGSAPSDTGPTATPDAPGSGDGAGGGTDTAGGSEVTQCPPFAGVVEWADAPSFGEVCPLTRQVGPLASCTTEATNWTARPVISGPLSLELSAAAAGAPATIKTQLDFIKSLCVFEYTGAGEPAAAELASVPAGFDPDCPIVVPEGIVEDEIWPKLRSDYVAALDMKGLGNVPPPAKSVRVAVIDDRHNKADDDLTPQLEVAGGAVVRSVHGLVVRQLIAELTCAAGSEITAVLSSHQALNLVRDGATGISEDNIAGHFGYHSQLLFALMEAYLRWQDSSQERLVVNLSVGWEETYGHVGGDVDADLLQAVKGIRDAIEVLACEGALVVAAAGNDPGGTLPAGGLPPQGATLPGAWEREKLRADCVVGGGYRPLLFAVGGVTRDDTDIVITRPKSTPRLVAPALHAAVAPPAACLVGDQPEIRETLTGTSMGAGVVSGLAAVIWSHQPTVEAHAVMQTIYDGSPSLGRPADVCTGSTGCADVHRATACTVLSHAGLNAGRAAVECQTVDIAWDKLPVFSSSDAAVASPAGANTVDASTTLVAAHPVDACGGVVMTPSCADAPERPCPGRQYFGGRVAPFRVDPQPGGDPCPSCPGLVSSSRILLTLVINPRFEHELTSPVFTLVGEASGEVYSWDLSRDLPPVLDPGQTYAVEVRPTQGFTPRTGYIDFVAQVSPTERYGTRSELVLTVGP